MFGAPIPWTTIDQESNVFQLDMFVRPDPA
ncbi:unnamed protein product, partial [Allacma fusca]